MTELQVTSAADLVWNDGLFGDRWTEVHGHKVSVTRVLGVIVECLGRDETDVRHFGLPVHQHAGLTDSVSEGLEIAARCEAAGFPG